MICIQAAALFILMIIIFMWIQLWRQLLLPGPACHQCQQSDNGDKWAIIGGFKRTQEIQVKYLWNTNKMNIKRSDVVSDEYHITMIGIWALIACIMQYLWWIYLRFWNSLCVVEPRQWIPYLVCSGSSRHLVQLNCVYDHVTDPALWTWLDEAHATHYTIL